MILKTKLSELSFFFINLAEFSINSLKMGSFLTGGKEVRIETPVMMKRRGTYAYIYITLA